MEIDRSTDNSEIHICSQLFLPFGKCLKAGDKLPLSLAHALEGHVYLEVPVILNKNTFRTEVDYVSEDIISVRDPPLEYQL